VLIPIIADQILIHSLHSMIINEIVLRFVCNYERWDIKNNHSYRQFGDL